MKNINLLAIILFSSFSLFAQNSKVKIKMYKVWVHTMDDSKTIKGYLFMADKKSIHIMDKKSTNKSKIATINAGTIKKIMIRRKGKVGKAMLIGGAVGLIVGGTAGLISGDDPVETRTVCFFGCSEWTFEGESAEDKASYLGISGAFIGAGLGAVFGSIKEKIAINGISKNYTSALNKLQGYSIKPITDN